ncbi:hypothetical protein EON65_46210 [archaeon]|nr:MAG: hypothetical protein EON65_46210 [archaeon]
MSNIAAVNLYTKGFQYQCERVAHEYYEDNEDAFLMTVHGLLAQHLPGVQLSSTQQERQVMNAD